MSVDFYTNIFFKGKRLSLDLGRYKNTINNFTIGSFIINDNVKVIITYKNNDKINVIKYCGPQSIQRINLIKNIQTITVEYSLCDPYTNKNSILNRYSIGKNFSIQENDVSKLKVITEQDNLTTHFGFIDFWYNGQTNHQGQYYKNVGISNDIYYDTNNQNKVIHNHLKTPDNYPLLNTNNISNCKFSCSSNSNTFGRKNCTLRCKGNGLSEKRMSNKKN